MRTCLFLAALGAAIFFSTSARACLDETQIQTVVAGAYPDSALAHRFAGERAQALVAGINATPPKTDYQADSVLVFAEPSQPRWRLVVLFRQGCVAERALLSTAVVDRLLRGLGQGA